MTTTTRPTATDAEKQALAELHGLFLASYGDHPLLADVRKQVCTEIDALLLVLEDAGIDTNALLEEIEGEA